MLLSRIKYRRLFGLVVIVVFLTSVFGVVVKIQPAEAESSGTLPAVAIHVSEYTETRWTQTAWTYFSLYEMLEEILISDGTPFIEVSDLDIALGGLMNTGMPKYPILFSMAVECISDTAASQVEAYVSAGGFAYVDASSWTKYPDGSPRTNFALSAQMGVKCINSPPSNYFQVGPSSKKVADNRIIDHFKNVAVGASMNWQLALTKDTLGYRDTSNHYVWGAQVTATAPADILMTTGEGYLMLATKPYANGRFIYDSEMAPLATWGIWGPCTYAYLTFRKAIEYAFEANGVPLLKLSPWPYQYNAAFTARHDICRAGTESNSYGFQWLNPANAYRGLNGSAQYERSLGVTGEYYVVTGELRDPLSAQVPYGNTPAQLVECLQNAQALGAIIVSHQGGLSSTPWTGITDPANSHYYHWGLDEGEKYYSSQPYYARDSLNISLNDLESWLGERPIQFGDPEGVGTMETTYQFDEALGIKISGNRQIGSFPNFALSMNTKDKHYDILCFPYSEYYISSGSMMIHMEVSHTPDTIRSTVDLYYDQGLFINIVGHQPAWTEKYNTYLTYCLSKPNMWNATSRQIRDWWLIRQPTTLNPTYQELSDGQRKITATLSGSTSADIALDMNFPDGQSEVYDLQVKLDGSPSTDYRQTSRGIKVKAGVASTVTITYRQMDKKYWTQTSQADFESGTRTNVDTSSNPGQIQLTSVSSGVTLFSDDFSDPSWTNSHWAVYNGTWTVSDGLYKQTGSAWMGSSQAGNTSWRDYIVEASGRYVSGTYGACLTGRLNPTTGSRYTLFTYPTSDGGPNTARLLKVSDYQSSGLWTLGTATITTDTNWHKLRMEFSGNTIKCYYDDALIITGTDNEYQTGAIALEYTYAQGEFDNVTVKAPATLFSDDFSDPSWTNSSWTVKSGTWSVADGTYNQTELNTTTSSLTYAGNASWSNYAVEARARYVDGWYGPWLGGRLNPTTGYRYVFYTYPNPAHGGPDKVGLAKFDHFGQPGGVAIAPEATVSFHDNNWHIMRMEFVGTTIRCYFDGAIVVTATDSSYSTGAVDVECWLNSTAEFDWITVKELTVQSYVSPSTLVSSPFDADSKSAWLTLSWNGFKPAGTDIKFRTRTASSQAALSSASWSNYYTASGSDITSPDNQWIQYEATLSTTNPSATPIVYDVTVCYSSRWLRWKQTTKADFESGTLTNLDTTSVPDQVSLAPAPPATLFSDDFSNATWTNSHWTVYGGQWTVIDGLYHQSDTVNWIPLTYTGDILWSNYAIEARARYISGTYGFATTGRLNPATGSRYTVLVYPTSTGGPNTARLVKVKDYASSGIWAMATATVTTDTNWHTTRLEFSGSTIKWYYDGVLKITATDDGVSYGGAAYMTGAVDLETGYAQVDYDWVTIQGLTGSGYYSSGTLVSNAFDAGSSAGWLPITWNASTPTGTSVKFRTRTAPTQPELSSTPWSEYYTTSGSMITSPPNRWIQYEATLSTSNTLITPTLYDVTIYYGGPPRLYIDPPSTEKTPADVGTTFKANVTIANIQDLFGFDFKLTWDNTLITLASVNFETSLDEVWGHDNWFPGINTTDTGFYQLAAVSTSTAFNGTTVLATLEFQVENTLSNSPMQTVIHIQIHKLSNSLGTAITHETTDALYTIMGQEPTLQLSPTSVTCRKYNERFSIEITVSEAYNFEDFEFEVHFDTTLLNFTGVSWTAWGSGTATVDEASGIAAGSTSGIPTNGTKTLVTIEFNATCHRIWKSIPGWTNDVTGTIYLESANLSYSTGPDLAYVKGGLDQINVGPDVTFKFSPIKGDIDNNGEVDVTDLRTVAYYYDVEEGDPLWTEALEYDLSKSSSENIIDIFDLVIIATNFGYTYP